MEVYLNNGCFFNIKTGYATLKPVAIVTCALA